MSDFVTTLLASASASVGLSAVVLFLAKSWIGERLKRSIGHEYDEKLASYKSEIVAEQSPRP